MSLLDEVAEAVKLGPAATLHLDGGTFNSTTGAVEGTVQDVAVNISPPEAISRRRRSQDVNLEGQDHQLCVVAAKDLPRAPVGGDAVTVYGVRKTISNVDPLGTGADGVVAYLLILEA